MSDEVVLPAWVPEGRPSKEMVEKGVYVEVVVPWKAVTVRYVPRIDELVGSCSDVPLAESAAYRYLVCFDKFASGGDVRDSSEARQLMGELLAMVAASAGSSVDDAASAANDVDDDLEAMLADVLGS